MQGFFLFQKESGPDWSRRKKTVFHLWQGLVLLLAALGLTLVSLLLSVGPYPLYFGKVFFQTPLILLLNYLPILGLLLLAYGITGRPALAFGVSGALVVGASMGNYYKLFFRDDPVMFADLAVLKEAGDMAGVYSLFLDWKIALAAVCFLGGIAFLCFFLRARLRKWSRAAVLLLGCAVLGIAVPVDLNESVYATGAANYSLLDSQWAQTQQYIAHGFVYPFIHSAREAVDRPPAGYSAKEAAALLDSYTDQDIPEGKKVNVLAVMLESFNDFSRCGAPELARDVYAVWHQLEAEGVSGNLISNTFAGGTTDSERSFLTGYTSLRNWRSDVNAFPRYFASQGYTVEGMHAYYGWFYNRANVNRYLGFENYYFLENRFSELTGGGIAYDNVFFPELLRTYQQAEKEGKPYFSYSLNYQGHGPYNSLYTEWGEPGDFVVNDGRYTPEQQNILENYLGSVADTGEHLKVLTDYLRTDEVPCVLVLFGDHNPILGDGNSVYAAMGLDLDLGSEEGFRNYFSTRYIIWANDAAKQALGRDFSGEGPEIGASFLMNELFSLCGWEGNAFLQAGTELMQQVPLIHSYGRFMENGRITFKLSPEAENAVNRFRKLQYFYSHSRPE